MSNSSLVTYTKLSPNCSSPRNHAIDTVTIHCIAANATIETLGDVFAATSRKASSQYGIGSDGRIGQYVDEMNRSWCTSSASNDNRAVTIEVANTIRADPWPISDEAYFALVDLLVDICMRNNIKKLLWEDDQSLIGEVGRQNMTVHRWFANKACPGDHLYNSHKQIAENVNRRLEEEDIMTGEQIYNALSEYLNSLPISEYAKESSKKGIESGLFMDGDQDGLVDNPRGILTREQFATVLNRAKILDSISEKAPEDGIIG